MDPFDILIPCVIGAFLVVPIVLGIEACSEASERDAALPVEFQVKALEEEATVEMAEALGECREGVRAIEDGNTDLRKCDLGQTLEVVDKGPDYHLIACRCPSKDDTRTSIDLTIPDVPDLSEPAWSFSDVR